MGEGVLLSRPDESVGLAADTLWVDALETESALAAGRADEALELYGGDFMTGVFLPDVSPALEEWIASTRTRLRSHAGKAAWAVATAAESAGNAIAAAAAARKAVALQPELRKAAFGG